MGTFLSFITIITCVAVVLTGAVLIIKSALQPGAAAALR